MVTHQVSKSNHVTAVTKIQVADAATIASMPRSNLSSQVMGRADTITPPLLNWQFATIMNMVVASDSPRV